MMLSFVLLLHMCTSSSRVDGAITDDGVIPADGSNDGGGSSVLDHSTESKFNLYKIVLEGRDIDHDSDLYVRARITEPLIVWDYT